MQTKLRIHSELFPPFLFEVGRLLNTNHFIRIIFELLHPIHILSSEDTITSHNFRFGIPSTLTALRDPELTSDVSIQGRWTSSAHQSYVRLVPIRSVEFLNVFLDFFSNKYFGLLIGKVQPKGAASI